MRLTIANKEATKYACLYFHYAKRVPVGSIAFNVYNDADEWCGCILYSRGATPQIGKPYGLAQGQVVELVRVALNGKQGKGRTSQAVSLSLKMLKKHCPMVRLVVSYADCDQNHLGTIYQATNWIYTGCIVPDKTRHPSFTIHGKSMHYRSVQEKLRKWHASCNLENVRKYIDPNAQLLESKGKRKYLFPMDKKTRKSVENLAKPYPKTDPNWTKIDRTQFDGNGENKLERGGQSRTAVSQVEPARSTVELFAPSPIKYIN